MRLILLRHGESKWNLENKFTGWEDIPLTQKGISEAVFSGKQILKENIQISSINTSILQRATETAKIVSETINFPNNKIKYDWRLNERHYGALQGLNKSETAAKYGEEQVLIWRRSYDIPPPLLKENDKRHPRNNPKFNFLNDKLPVGESLKDVIDRLIPFWKDYFNRLQLIKGSHLIVAHSNSLRAIIKILDNLSDNEIVSVNIPTGVPLVYTFGKKYNVKNKKYLIDRNELRIKENYVKNQGSMK